MDQSPPLLQLLWPLGEKHHQGTLSLIDPEPYRGDRPISRFSLLPSITQIVTSRYQSVRSHNKSLHTISILQDSDSAVSNNNKNNNNNNNARTMFMVLTSWLRVIATVHLVHVMNAEQCQMASDLWTKPMDLNHRRLWKSKLHHHRHVLLLSLKADTHFTIPQRASAAGYIPRRFTCPWAVTHLWSMKLMPRKRASADNADCRMRKQYTVADNKTSHSSVGLSEICGNVTDRQWLLPFTILLTKKKTKWPQCE